MKTLKYLLLAGLSIGVVSCNSNQQKKTETVSNPTEKANAFQQQTTKPLSGKIEIDSLPLKAKEFIANNYKGYKISSAAYDPLCGGGDAIDVSITQKGKPNFSLIFLPNGTFVQQEEDIELSLAPKKVLTTAKAKFSDYKVANQIEKLKLADNSLQYLLDLTKGSETKEVILTEDGKIVCESKE